MDVVAVTAIARRRDDLVRAGTSFNATAPLLALTLSRFTGPDPICRMHRETRNASVGLLYERSRFNDIHYKFTAYHQSLIALARALLKLGQELRMPLKNVPTGASLMLYAQRT